MRLIGSRDGRQGSVTIHQNVDLYATNLSSDASVSHTLRPGRVAWVQVARGAVDLNGHLLSAGDGASVEDIETLTLTSTSQDAEVLMFDMAA